MHDIWQFLEPDKIIRQASLGPPVYLLLLWHPWYSTLGVPECITTLGSYVSVTSLVTLCYLRLPVHLSLLYLGHCDVLEP